MFAVLLAVAAPAQAQTQQNGLVNVALEDIVVQLPISIAANVCDVNVAVLARLADQGGTCRATADSAASSGKSGNGNVRQDGLVNVLAQDIVIQAPISLAANICDVNVAVLAEVLDAGSACEAQAGSDADAGGGNGSDGGATAFQPIQLGTVVGGVTFLDNLSSNDGASPPGLPVIGPGAKMKQVKVRG